MLKVLFRVDATHCTGAGHLMRCVALAQALVKNGGHADFTGFYEASDITDMMRKNNIPIIKPGYAQDKVGTEDDLKFTSALLNEGYDWIVLDNYYFDQSYQRMIKESGCNLLVLSDMDEMGYECDILLNHGVHALLLDYSKSHYRKLLLGPEYALIRHELKAVRDKRNDRPLGNILVTLGGHPDTDLLLMLAKALQLEEATSEFKVRILAGVGENAAEKFRKLINDNGLRDIEICGNTLYPNELYQWADIAVTAGGGTCWELCHYGVAGLVGFVAANQEGICKALDSRAIFKSVGNFHAHTAETMAQELRVFLSDREGIVARMERARNLVDGKGPERVVAVMEEINAK